MSKITLIGDIHGEFRKLHKILENPSQADRTIIALGDIGIGFGQDPLFPDNFKFIHGNHDNPDLCKHYSGFLGRYGFDKETGIFYVSGAESIDKDQRIEGATWWSNEQLSYREGMSCLELYESIKPKIVISHDVPYFLYDELLIAGGHSGKKHTNVQNMLLNGMLDKHVPDVWFFGHFHVSHKTSYKGCLFRCLNELETMEINV